ncbi:hypothetical protein TEA_008728 [Camellia sinensis var. sinensis]|uniref:Uncharacterized protein n=1 Tax=Camellia sinensis var. sinensis TaxID=542762 RepID=A0A4S4E244_CAMSN|nr:hypothetical protein TEA_008728 [Camellia sinensis var. sinensis]
MAYVRRAGYQSYRRYGNENSHVGYTRWSWKKSRVTYGRRQFYRRRVLRGVPRSCNILRQIMTKSSITKGGYSLLLTNYELGNGQEDRSSGCTLTIGFYFKGRAQLTPSAMKNPSLHDILFFIVRDRSPGGASVIPKWSDIFVMPAQDQWVPDCAFVNVDLNSRYQVVPDFRVTLQVDGGFVVGVGEVEYELVANVEAFFALYKAVQFLMAFYNDGGGSVWSGFWFLKSIESRIGLSSLLASIMSSSSSSATSLDHLRPCSVISGYSREMDSKLTMNRFSSAQVFSCGAYGCFVVKVGEVENELVANVEAFFALNKVVQVWLSILVMFLSGYGLLGVEDDGRLVCVLQSLANGVLMFVFGLQSSYKACLGHEPIYSLEEWQGYSPPLIRWTRIPLVSQRWLSAFGLRAKKGGAWMDVKRAPFVIMPPSALDRLASLHIDYPMLFELHNAATERMSHCGVLEFIAEEGMIYMPYWVGILYLETTLRNFSCLTTGDSIMVAYNNKKYCIDIIETKPSNAISIIETDCEVDFAPPLDYKEPEKPVVTVPSGKAPAGGTNALPYFTWDGIYCRKSVWICFASLYFPGVECENGLALNISKSTAYAHAGEEVPAETEPKFNPFTGAGRRLDGKPLKYEPPPVSSSSGSKDKRPDVASGGGQPSTGIAADVNVSQPMRLSIIQQLTPTKELNKQDAYRQKDEPKFQPFTGKKYSLKG